MEDIIDSLIGYAQINGRLPCPADANGQEDWLGTGNDCTTWFGNVPARTIAFDGNYNQGVLIDPWGSPYRYQVTAFDSTIPADTFGDFITSNGMQAAGIANLVVAGPHLQICNVQPAAHTAAAPNDDTACDNAASTVVTDVAVVLISLGKNKANVIAATSDIQSENLDNSGTDTVFVSSTRSDAAGTEYDDVVKWISLSKLFSRMIAAEQLP